LNKRYNDELELERVNEKQYQKYLIIKNNAILSVNKEKAFLKDMRQYEAMSMQRIDGDIAQKKKRFNELEFQVYTIKSDTVQVQKKLDEIKIKSLDIYKNIKEIKLKNSELSEDYQLNLRDYLRIKIKLYKIFKELKVKSLPEIIKIFNEQNFQYQSLHSQFFGLNKRLSELNMEYTNLKNEFELINSKIHSRFDSQAQVPVNKKILQNDDDEIIEIDIKLKELIEINSSTNEKISNCIKFLNNVVKYLYYYNGKLNELMTSLYKSNNIEWKNFVKVKISRNNLDSSYMSNVSNISNMSKVNKPIKNNSNSPFEWDMTNIKNIINFFIAFCQKVIYVISTMSTNVAIDIYISNLQNPKNSTPKKFQWDNPKKKFAVIFIYEEQIVNKLDEFVEHAIVRLENKRKILNRSEREIFKDRKETENKKK
jgi:hypothetical protein